MEFEAEEGRREDSEQWRRVDGNGTVLGELAEIDEVKRLRGKSEEGGGGEEEVLVDRVVSGGDRRGRVLDDRVEALPEAQEEAQDRPKAARREGFFFFFKFNSFFSCVRIVVSFCYFA